MSKGNCRAATDPEVFFHAENQEKKSLTLDFVEEATIADFCARCPVQVKCLQYALDRPDLCGIWGGTTDKMRRTLRRGRPRSRCLKCSGSSIKTLGKAQICRSCGITWRWTV